MTILELKDVQHLSITDTTVEAVLRGGRIVSYTYAKSPSFRAKGGSTGAPQLETSPREGRTLDGAPSKSQEMPAEPAVGVTS